MTYPPAHPGPPQGQSGPSSPSYAPQAAYGRPPVSAPQGGTTYGQAPTPAGSAPTCSLNRVRSQRSRCLTHPGPPPSRGSPIRLRPHTSSHRSTSRISSSTSSTRTTHEARDRTPGPGTWSGQSPPRATPPRVTPPPPDRRSWAVRARKPPHPSPSAQDRVFRGAVRRPWHSWPCLALLRTGDRELHYFYECVPRGQAKLALHLQTDGLTDIPQHHTEPVVALPRRPAPLPKPAHFRDDRISAVVRISDAHAPQPEPPSPIRFTSTPSSLFFLSSSPQSGQSPPYDSTRGCRSHGPGS